MDPSNGQNLFNIIFFVGSGLSLLSAVIAYALNFIAKDLRPRRQRRWLEIAQVTTIVAVLITMLARLALSYFDNLAEIVKPYRQSILTAEATVEVYIASSEPYNDHFIEQGGYLTFVRGSQSLLTTSAADCRAFQQGGNSALFRGVFTMDATDRAVGNPVSSLSGAQHIEIGFAPMPKESHVVEGRVIMTINNTVRLEFTIPEQDTINGSIYILNLKPVFKDFK